MAGLPCDNCGSSDGLEDYTNGAYCFVCHYKEKNKRLCLESDQNKQKKPKKIELLPLNSFWTNWLKDKGINEKTIQHFNIQFDRFSESVAYPCREQSTKKILGYQLRDKDKKIKTIRFITEYEHFLFEARINDSEQVVLVEDAVSAMRIWQDTKNNAIALLGTNLAEENLLYIIKNYKRIIVWLDGDLAGYQAAERIINNLQQFVYSKIFFTRADPKDLDFITINRCIKWICNNE